MMMSLDAWMKCHDLVTIFDATEHILPSNAAEKRLTIPFYKTLNCNALSLSPRVARVLKH